MTCAKCGADNRASNRFCTNCGSLLAIRCPACNAENDPGTRFCGQCGQAAQPASAPAARAATDGGERRQLTVMFCDLVGSTKLDPEALREVLVAYQEACRGVIARYGGFIARYMGDGILIYFGYPQAHEDEAERAVRSGLGIVAAVSALRPRPDLQLKVRVGIATGLVIVGDLIGEGAAEERAVLGETSNLAARLQGLAGPNGVVVAPATKRLIEGRFWFTDLGEHALKGMPALVHAWRVDSERSVETEFGAARAVTIIGREAELALVVDRWRRAHGGAGQVILLSGEAGIGKSTFVHALRRAAKSDAHVFAHIQCSAHQQ